MRVNPIIDAIRFLTDSPLFYVFDLLVIASLVIVAINLQRDPAQRSIKDLSMFALRFVMGCMWWQQSLWKLPPTYTDRPDGTGGLHDWVSKMVDGAAFHIQSDFVQYIVLPHFQVFAPMVYAIEVLIGASFITGTAVRLFSLLGAAMAINLWLGLYRTPYEWPWTYVFLTAAQLLFFILDAGRSLGGDALIARRLERTHARYGLGSRILALIT